MDNEISVFLDIRQQSTLIKNPQHHIRKPVKLEKSFLGAILDGTPRQIYLYLIPNIDITGVAYEYRKPNVNGISKEDTGYLLD